MTSPIQAQAARASAALAAEKDAIILRVLNQRLGADWTPEAIQSRCHVQSSLSTGEVFFLDGQPLVRFEDVKITRSGQELNITLAYRIYDDQGCLVA